MKAQTIQIDSIFTADGEIFPFSPNDTIYGLSISGSVHLFSDTSLVRVILSDSSGNEWMVYEAYPMIVTDTAFEIEEECDETCYLEEFYAYSIEIQIIDAYCKIDSLNVDSIIHEGAIFLQYQAKENKDLIKAQKINEYIAGNGWPWIAATNDISGRFYSEKALLFGNKYNLFGKEFYSGGNYYCTLHENIPNHTDTEMISSFDWRKKHDANISGSPYYRDDGEEPSNGWLTGLRVQGSCGSCSAFAGIASLEAAINLYANYQFDVVDNARFSEKDAFNCSNNGGGNEGCDCESGKQIYVILNKIRDEGVVDDGCYPYLTPYCEFTTGTCEENSSKCPNPDWTAQMCERDVFHLNDYTDQNERANYLKELLLNNGPLTIELHLFPSSDPLESHAVSLVGFDYDETTGKINWICKESYGSGWGQNGYDYEPFFLGLGASYGVPYIDNNVHGFVYDPQTCPNPISVLCHFNPQFQYTVHENDFDKDGYYNWGIGERQQGFPCSNEEDWNDNNYRIGPCDDNFIGLPVKPEMEVIYGLLNGIPVNNNDLVYITGNSANENHYTFLVNNTGNAQLNFKKISIPTPPHARIVIDYQNHEGQFEVSEIDVLDTAICMDSYETFQIVMHEGADPGDLAHIIIYLNEPDMSNFEFTLIFDACETQEGTEIITTNPTVWSDPFTTKLQDIHIEDGASLTINGTVILSHDVDIVVAAGGILVIDGGRIENAVTGIETGNSPDPRRYPSGGIVSCTDAVFTDNITDVILYPFTHRHPEVPGILPNFSRFKRTQFKTTDQLYETFNQVPYTHLMLDNVGYVNILGCEFRNDASGENLPRGNGITSHASEYFISTACQVNQNPCPTEIPCRFENLDYGIWSNYITPSETGSIRNSVFVNNTTGIYLSACAYPVVTQNVFHVRKAEPAPLGQAVHCGLYLDNCTGYQVEENFFYTFFDEEQREDFQAVGLVVHNSGPENNEIYNNTFEGLYAGLIAQEVNRNEEGDKGLQIKCNNLSNNVYDIAVTHVLSGLIGIAEVQGTNGPDRSSPAGNLFSYSWTNDESDYYNDCAEIRYWHHNYSNDHNVIPENYSEDLIIPILNENNLEYDPLLSCPSHLIGGGLGIEEEKTAMLFSGQHADSVYNLLAQMIDGGSTDELLLEIQTSWPEDGYELYSELISESPYLSDTSMIEAVGKEDVLLPGMITDVLIANPQSAKSEDVMTAADERDNPLTDDQMADIGEGRFIIGAREALEMDYAFQQYQKDIAKHNLVRYYRTDTLLSSCSDSIIEILNFQPSLSEEYIKAFEYLKMGDSMNVSGTLDAIPGNYELAYAELLEHALYVEYFDLLFSLDSDDSTNIALDSAQIALCYNILNNASGKIQAYARNLLIMNDSLDYQEVIILPEPGLKSGKVRRWPVHTLINENYLKIYPNPAKNVVIIETRLKEEPCDAFINIIDNKGIKFKSYPILKQNEYQVIPLSDLQSGILLCQLIVRHKIAETRKLIIVK